MTETGRTGAVGGERDGYGRGRILWLRPTKPQNISVGRERIATHLEDEGWMVEFVDASGFDAFGAVWEGLTGEYDIVVGTVRMGLYVGFPLATVLDLPLVGDVTDPIEQIDHLPRPLYDLLYRYEHFALAQADDCTFTYSSSYEQARIHGIDGVRVFNGVDYDLFANPAEAVVNEARAHLHDARVDPDDRIAVYVGGLSDVYHLDAILEAAENTPDWDVVVIGAGPLVETVESAAAALPNVHYLGSFDYELMPGFLAHADLGFCLVDAEQPLKVLEYGAAGLPTLAIEGELETRFSNDELLFVDPEGAAISKAMTRLAENPRLGAEYARNLRAKAKASDWSIVANKYENLLRELNHG